MRSALVLVVVLAGCGGGDGRVIGDQCNSGNTCGVNPRAACILAWPEGYCTELECVLGSCPSGSRCVTRVSFPNVPFDAFCLETCEATAECRDQYRCVEVSATAKVCVPAQP